MSVLGVIKLKEKIINIKIGNKSIPNIINEVSKKIKKEFPKDELHDLSLVSFAKTGKGKDRKIYLKYLKTEKNDKKK